MLTTGSTHPIVGMPTIGDEVTTYLLLADPERIVVNPVVLSLLDVGGFALFAIAKLAVLVLSIGLFVLIDRVELDYVEVVPITWYSVIGLLGMYATVTTYLCCSESRR